MAFQEKLRTAGSEEEDYAGEWLIPDRRPIHRKHIGGQQQSGKSTDYMELIANYKKEIFDKVKNNENGGRDSNRRCFLYTVEMEKTHGVCGSADRRRQGAAGGTLLNSRRRRQKRRESMKRSAPGRSRRWRFYIKDSNVPYGEFATGWRHHLQWGNLCL